MTKELFEQISELYETAKTNHEDTGKAAKGRARKALSGNEKSYCLIQQSLCC